MRDFLKNVDLNLKNVNLHAYVFLYKKYGPTRVIF